MNLPDISSIFMFYKQTKHTEVDWKFIREKLFGCIVTNFVKSNDQLVYVFTKAHPNPQIHYIYRNLDRMTYQLQLERECKNRFNIQCTSY